MPNTINPPAAADRGRLLIVCPDQPGIVAAVSRFLFDCGANIVHSDQHTTDPSGGLFFLRIEFDLPELADAVAEMDAAFAEAIATPRGMQHRFTVAARQKRLAVFVSKEDHCLMELLWQQRSGDLGAEIAAVISNHEDCGPLVTPFGIPFHYVPVTRDIKAQAEEAQLSLLAEANIDGVVLARYMQIVSGAFIRHWENRIINIHHSFLPAFVGAKPYAQAHARGVKIIGATAHYVTEELDAGPIIEQDVQRVDHRHSVEDLKRIGRQIERTVLARAVAWHAQDRVLVYGNKTVVFA